MEQCLKVCIAFCSYVLILYLTAEILVCHCNGTVDEVYSRGEELRKMGLNVPEITEVFAKLRAKGIDVPANVYTVEQGEKILRTLLKGGASV